MPDKTEQETDTNAEQETDSKDEQSTDSETEQENDSQDSESESKEKKDSETEQEKSEDEQSKEDTTKKTFANTVKRVEEMVKNNEEVPPNLMWAMSHIDVDNLDEQKEQTEDEIFDEKYGKRRDKEKYDDSIKDLKKQYEDEDVKKIEDQVDDLVDNHSMGKMKAFELVTAGLEPSETDQRKESRDAQTFPARKDVTEDTDLSDYDEVAKNYKTQTGRTLNKESYKKTREAGLI